VNCPIYDFIKSLKSFSVCLQVSALETSISFDLKSRKKKHFSRKDAISEHINICLGKFSDKFTRLVVADRKNFQSKCFSMRISFSPEKEKVEKKNIFFRDRKIFFLRMFSSPFSSRLRLTVACHQ
jgi:hypothetical protein